MGAKDLSLDDCCERQVVKEFSQHFPDVVVLVLAHTFVIESIVLSDASGLVVASEDGETFLVPDFETEEEADSLGRVVSSVDIVPQEEVVRGRDIASDSEEFHKIVELPMDVSADVDGSPNVDNIGLFREYLSTWLMLYLALSHNTFISCSFSSLHCESRSMYSSKLPNSSRDSLCINLNLKTTIIHSKLIPFTYHS